MRFVSGHGQRLRLDRRGHSVALILFALTVTATAIASSMSRATLPVGAVTPMPTCSVEGVDAFCQPVLHRVIPPHGQIRLAAINGQHCGSVPGMAPLCTPPTPPVFVMNNADIPVISDEGVDLTIVAFTYPYGFIVSTDSSHCVVNERENVAACPVASVNLNASPETFTTSPLPPGQWELVSNPFDVPVRVSLGAVGELWTWDGSQYNATDVLGARQSAWAILYVGGSLQLTALPPPTPACPPAGCP